MTTTIGGRCPECWHPKSPLGVRPARRYRPAMFDPDAIDIWSLSSWLPVPIGALLVTAGLLASSPVLLITGVAAILARIGGALLPWETWW